MTGYHWAKDHRIHVVKVTALRAGKFKATCDCGEQSKKGADEEVRRWVESHLKESKTTS